MVAFKKILAVALLAATGTLTIAGGTQIGVDEPHNLVVKPGKSRQEVISYPRASYVALHFSEFNLPEGEVVIVRSPDSSVSYEYTGLGRADQGKQGGFYATFIPGNTAIIEYRSLGMETTKSEYGFKIDKFARGFPKQQESICGGFDESLPAKCYKLYFPAMYTKTQAVARLLINGNSLCTGWLVGSEGHMLTNQHCIYSASTANYVDIEFDAESDECWNKCETPMGCKGKVIANKAKFIQSNKKNDWALIKLPESVDLSSYGYLQLRADGPVPHEKIYIPQHPKGWAKRIAYFVKGGNVATVTSLTAANSCGTDQVGYQADTRKSAAWTDARRLVLIRAVKKQVAKGKATDNGLKKEAWTAVLDEFNVTNGLRYTKAQLQSQWTVLKKKYTIFQSLVNNSGFGWDEDAKLPTAPAEVTQDSDKHAMHSLIGGEQVWQEYLAAHKEAKEFQSKTLKHYNDLHEIFSGSVATGEYAQGCRSSVQEVETARSTSSEDFHEDFHDSLTSREMPQSPTTSQTRSPTTSQASVNDASPAHLLPSARSSLSPRTITPAAPATPDVADGPLRKRQRSSRNQVADSLRFLATSQLKLAEIRERENVTATQLAFRDFSERFRAYPARSKIRFARHLAANENEARMYLELDEDVKIEYVNDVLDEMN